MESWREAWRRGIAPQLSVGALTALRDALRDDDPRLLQGATTSPPPLHCVQDSPCEAACSIGYGGWQGDGLQTVAEVEEFFATVCFETDLAIGEPASCRWFINWTDETDRSTMIAELLPEVEKVLNDRLLPAH
jgi:hypothetical protein